LIVRVRLLALAGYGMQAAFALGTILLVAALLPAAEFSRFSVLAAAAQFAAIFGFEWIRIAATRFYPGENEAAALSGRRTTRLLFLRMAMVLFAAALCFWLSGIDWQLLLPLTGLALAQALSDLHQTMVRFDGLMQRFTRMQFARSLLLFGATVSGAWMGGTALSALMAMLAGHVAALVTNRLIDWPQGKSDTHLTDGPEMCKYAAYGMPAALASVLHSGVPVLVRAILIHYLGTGAAAAYVLALDLFQRPLALISVALNGVLYPEVVREHRERPSCEAARRRLYTANVAALALSSGLLIAFAPELAALGVRADLQVGFMKAAPWLVAFFLYRSLVQNIFSVRWQLNLRTWLLALVGFADIALVSGFVWFAALAYPSHANNMMVALAGSALTLVVVNGGVQMMRREPLPRTLLIGSLPLLGLFGTISFWTSSLDWLSLLAKIGAAATVSLLWAWATMRVWRKAQ
jgi:hypothetical protein